MKKLFTGIIAIGLLAACYNPAFASTKSPVPLNTDAVVLTKSDTTIVQCNQWYVGGTGNANVVTAAGSTVLFTALPVGAIIPLAITQLLSTSTTATLVVCLK